MEDLVRGIKSGQAILFAGAGLSANLGAPTWSGLVNKMATDLGYDPAIFQANGASPWALAEYYKIKKSSVGPLRSWMDKAWNATDEQIIKSEPHKIISRIGFESIYTTNYDHNIERSLALNKIQYNKIANVKDFTYANKNLVNVIKLHGDFEDDKSIILAESDYFKRLSFDSPLDVKLRSDAVAKSVLFLGYSLGDFNIRYLVYKLWEVWEASDYSKERPRSYIFLATPDAISEEIFRNWGIVPITGKSDDPGAALTEFLRLLEAKATT